MGSEARRESWFYDESHAKRISCGEEEKKGRREEERCLLWPNSWPSPKIDLAEVPHWQVFVDDPRMRVALGRRSPRRGPDVVFFWGAQGNPRHCQESRPQSD